MAATVLITVLAIAGSFHDLAKDSKYSPICSEDSPSTTTSYGQTLVLGYHYHGPGTHEQSQGIGEEATNPTPPPSTQSTTSKNNRPTTTDAPVTCHPMFMHECERKHSNVTTPTTNYFDKILHNIFGSTRNPNFNHRGRIGIVKRHISKNAIQSEQVEETSTPSNPTLDSNSKQALAEVLPSPVKSTRSQVKRLDRNLQRTLPKVSPSQVQQTQPEVSPSQVQETQPKISPSQVKSTRSQVRQSQFSNTARRLGVTSTDTEPTKGGQNVAKRKAKRRAIQSASQGNDMFLLYTACGCHINATGDFNVSLLSVPGSVASIRGNEVAQVWLKALRHGKEIYQSLPVFGDPGRMFQVSTEDLPPQGATITDGTTTDKGNKQSENNISVEMGINTSQAAPSFMLLLALTGDVSVSCQKEPAGLQAHQSGKNGKQDGDRSKRNTGTDKDKDPEMNRAFLLSIVIRTVPIAVAAVLLVAAILVWRRYRQEKAIDHRRRRQRNQQVSVSPRRTAATPSEYEEMDETGVGYCRYSDPVDCNSTLLAYDVNTAIGAPRSAADKSPTVVKRGVIARSSPVVRRAGKVGALLAWFGPKRSKDMRAEVFEMKRIQSKDSGLAARGVIEESVISSTLSKGETSRKSSRSMPRKASAVSIGADIYEDCSDMESHSARRDSSDRQDAQRKLRATPSPQAHPRLNESKQNKRPLPDPLDQRRRSDQTLTKPKLNLTGNGHPSLSTQRKPPACIGDDGDTYANFSKPKTTASATNLSPSYNPFFAKLTPQRTQRSLSCDEYSTLHEHLRITDPEPATYGLSSRSLMHEYNVPADAPVYNHLNDHNQKKDIEPAGYGLSHPSLLLTEFTSTDGDAYNHLNEQRPVDVYNHATYGAASASLPLRTQTIVTQPPEYSQLNQTSSVRPGDIADLDTYGDASATDMPGKYDVEVQAIEVKHTNVSFYDKPGKKGPTNSFNCNSTKSNSAQHNADTTGNTSLYTSLNETSNGKDKPDLTEYGPASASAKYDKDVVYGNYLEFADKPTTSQSIQTAQNKTISAVDLPVGLQNQPTGPQQLINGSYEEIRDAVNRQKDRLAACLNVIKQARQSADISEERTPQTKTSTKETRLPHKTFTKTSNKSERPIPRDRPSLQASKSCDSTNKQKISRGIPYCPGTLPRANTTAPPTAINHQYRRNSSTLTGGRSSNFHHDTRGDTGSSFQNSRPPRKGSIEQTGVRVLPPSPVGPGINSLRDDKTAVQKRNSLKNDDAGGSSRTPQHPGHRADTPQHPGHRADTPQHPGHRADTPQHPGNRADTCSTKPNVIPGYQFNDAPDSSLAFSSLVDSSNRYHQIWESVVPGMNNVYTTLENVVSSDSE